MVRDTRKLRLKAVWLLVLPFFWFSAPTPGRLTAGAVLALIGLGIRAWAAGTIRKDRELSVGGPYAHTRNPLYLGSFFLGLGLTLAGGHWIWPAAFLVFYLTVYGRTLAYEREVLTGLFGEAYEAYCRAVPAVVPRLTPWRPDGASSSGFTPAQYVRNREWEAALGTAAAFGFLTARAFGLI